MTEYDGVGRRIASNDAVLGRVEEWKYEDVLGRQTYYKRTVAPYAHQYEEYRTYTDTATEHTVVTEEKVGGETIRRSTAWLDAMGRTLHTLAYVVRGAETVEAHRYFEYDARGNVVARREPIGDGPTAADAQATTAATALTRSAYDAAGNLLSETDPPAR